MTMIAFNIMLRAGSRDGATYPDNLHSCLSSTPGWGCGDEEGNHTSPCLGRSGAP